MEIRTPRHTEAADEYICNCKISLMPLQNLCELHQPEHLVKNNGLIIKYLLQLYHFYTDHSIELQFPAASLLDIFCHLSKSEKLPTFSED